ncbi:MAG TPA: DUF309 domain-containing protein [Acidobacteriota bacterium]|nr:DUF309 domain-containing protein [Acidobacteriota bacterium]
MRRYCRRPFPPYRHRPGRTPHPVLDEGGHLYGQEEPRPGRFDPQRWEESEDYLWGADLFNHGYFWEAHEAWEGLWRGVRGRPEGDFLRGLIQVAAAFLKRAQGREKGTLSLRGKAFEKLRPLAEGRGRYAGVRLADWMQDVDEALSQDKAAPPLLIGEG